MESELGAKEAELRDWKVLRGDMNQCLSPPASLNSYPQPNLVFLNSRPAFPNVSWA